MTETRSITLHADAVTQQNVQKITGQKEYQNAIGYLSGWNMSFPHLTLTVFDLDSGPEISAVYRKESSGPVEYVIGAIWHSDTPRGEQEQTGQGHFGFHS